jgi:CDP-glucose 4,6-dehydratase
MTPAFWLGKSVFITGHTGFKGSWLALWLQRAGANVHGYALAPPTSPSLFEVARVADGLASHHLGDIMDGDSLRKAMAAAAPEVVMHLAAQSLVRYSYQEPVETFATNVLGTVNVLEAVRAMPCVRAVVSVTTDKCYQNNEWHWGYRETEPLGGRDPYSSSKACAELVTSAYRDSFLDRAGVAVASARAGNVIGGGDWARDRLLPDYLRALDEGKSLEVRHPAAIRPWQHVLEPLAGYLLLAQRLVMDGSAFAQAWNFGPADDEARPVSWILDQLAAAAPGTNWRHAGVQELHEASYLKLDSSKARNALSWRPRWGLSKALDMTVAWHKAWRSGRDMRQYCLAQIDEYQDSAGT